MKEIPTGKGVKMRDGNDVAVLSLGTIGNMVENAVARASEAGINAAWYDMIFLKPLDRELLKEAAEKNVTIITVEDGAKNGGFGSAVTEWLNDNGYHNQVIRIGVPDNFVSHGKVPELMSMCEMDEDAIYRAHNFNNPKQAKMRIVIAGAGEVGTHLAKLLSREEQDIVVIDPDSYRLANLDANYNLMTLKGNPISFKDLRKAGVEKCDLFIAVTPEETQNILACSIARNIGAQRTVARIDNFEFMSEEHQEYFTRMGVNALIYPELLAAQEIYTALHRTWVRHWFELHDGEIIILGVKLRDNAQIIGMQLKEFAQIKHNFHVAAIKTPSRDHHTARRRCHQRERYPIFRHTQRSC